MSKRDDGYNILFIFTDQMHGFAMGCMGNPDVKTPYLDALAAQGTLFTNAYSCAPVCTPSRVVLQTGRYACQTGVLANSLAIPDGERALAPALNEGGYHTSYVGRWHIGGAGYEWVPPEHRHGFTDFIGYQSAHNYLHDVWMFDEQGNTVASKDHRTDMTTDVAIERLERIADEKFALFVSYLNPHYPLEPSQPYADMYTGVRIARRPNSQDVSPLTVCNIPRWLVGKVQTSDPKYNPDVWTMDRYIKLYCAMITQMDYNIGRLLTKLENLGLVEKTVVIFTSDHGDMQGSHGLNNKSVFWEESVRVPLIARAPGSPKGRIIHQPVSGIEWFPSILDYAGLPAEPSAEQPGFAPLTMGEEQELSDAVFSELETWLMIREGKYKLVVNKDSFAPTHLFDLEHDPYELDNLVAQESAHEDRERLREKLQAWRTDVMKRANPAHE